MKKKSLIALLVVPFISIWFIYKITHVKIDYMGDRSSIDFEALDRKENKILLTAELEAFPYCKICLVDSIKIEIEAGDNKGTTKITRNYFISGDTIVIKGDLESIRKFVNTNKFLIRKNKVLFSLNNNQYDTIKAMNIKKNKLNLVK